MSIIGKLVESLEAVEVPNDRHFKKIIKAITHCKHKETFGVGQNSIEKFLRLIMQKYPEKLDELFMTKIESIYFFQFLFARSNEQKIHRLLFEILSQLAHENQEQLLEQTGRGAGLNFFYRVSYNKKSNLFLLYFNLILTQHRKKVFPKLIKEAFLSDVFFYRSDNTIRTVFDAANEHQPQLLLQALLKSSIKRYFDLNTGKYSRFSHSNERKTVVGNILHYQAETRPLEFLVDLLRRLEKQIAGALPSGVFTAINEPFKSNLGIIAAQNKKSPEAFPLFWGLLEELPPQLLQEVVTHRNADGKNILQAIAINQPFAVFLNSIQMLRTKLPDTLLEIFEARESIEESLIASMLEAYSAEELNHLLQVFNAESDLVFYNFLINNPGFLGKVASFYPEWALDYFCRSIEKNDLDAAYEMADAGYTLDYEAFRDEFCSRNYSNAQLLQYQTAFHRLLECKHMIEPEYQNYFRLFTLDANNGFEFTPVPREERLDLSECCKLVLSTVGKREKPEQTMKRLSDHSSLSLLSASSQNSKHDKHDLKQVNKLLSQMDSDFILLRTHALVNPKIGNHLLHLASWEALDFEAQNKLLTILDDVQNSGPIEKASAQMVLQFQSQLDDSKKEIGELKTEMRAIKEQSATMLQLLTSLSDKFCHDEPHSAASL